MECAYLCYIIIILHKYQHCASMNEPHDVPDINMWAQSVQAAVTAIRNAGYVNMDSQGFYSDYISH